MSIKISEVRTDVLEAEKQIESAINKLISKYQPSDVEVSLKKFYNNDVTVDDCKIRMIRPVDITLSILL